MDEIKFSKGEVIKINSKIIQELKQKVLMAPLKRVRLCLHRDTNEALQEMIIVLHKDSYIRPHKHIGKDESFHIIEGSFFVIVFDESGKIIEKIFMNTRKKGDNLLCRLAKNHWHMVIPISDFVVFHETIEGPYTGSDDSIFAPWAPQEGDHIGIKRLVREILNYI